ncbi:MAG: bifunctional diaminohydroxyphosphoribosylaminopyrimidine deaminase/5-amino-6-(5-phosphoribosylamino)uracil reductase RibD [Desulfobulbaceae bacterium]
MTQDDTRYMRMALEEAAKGRGRTSPNPCVGAVVVRDGRVVGRGYHRKAGTPHAEVHAIADAGDDCAGATIYVTLEPCNHTGRTPPCTRAILEAGISRVVVGMADPNPSVTGGGSDFLRSMGLDVETGLLEDECRALNRPFIKHSMTGIPWVVMKAGMSLDGRISYVPNQGGRITGEDSRRMTHELRDTLDAILIGVDTAIIDDPSLTTRLDDREGRDPLRVILDTRLRLSPDAAMLRLESPAQTWIYCGTDADPGREKALTEAGARVHRVETGTDGRLDPAAVLAHLGTNDITSVLVEGGARVHGSLLAAGLVDEVYLFMAPRFIGEAGTPLLAGFSAGSPEACPELHEVESRSLGGDLLIHGLLARR